MPPSAIFGRRANLQATPLARTRAGQSPPGEAEAPELLPIDSMIAPDAPSLDDELREWKRTRGFQMPWRQISLMASLCFGIASLVLPDTTNDAVSWLLYGLMAISFVAGITRRRKRAETANSA